MGIDLNFMFSSILISDEKRALFKEGAAISKEKGANLTYKILNLATEVCENIFRKVSQVPQFIRAALRLLIDA